MYDQDKILVLGGGTPTTNTGGKIDLSVQGAVWQPAR